MNIAWDFCAPKLRFDAVASGIDQMWPLYQFGSEPEGREDFYSAIEEELRRLRRQAKSSSVLLIDIVSPLASEIQTDICWKLPMGFDPAVASCLRDDAAQLGVTAATRLDELPDELIRRFHDPAGGQCALQVVLSPLMLNETEADDFLHVNRMHLLLRESLYLLGGMARTGGLKALLPELKVW